MSELYKGKQIILKDTDIYSDFYNKNNLTTLSGIFYIYKEDIKNNRIAICRSKNECGIPGFCTGFVNIYKIIDLESIEEGSVVIVNGNITEFADGKGKMYGINNKEMVVTDILDENEYINNIGVGFNKSNDSLDRLGFANKNSIINYYK